MKLLNFCLILVFILLASCAKEKNNGPTPLPVTTEQDTVIATLNYVSTLLPASPFRIDSVVVSYVTKKKKHLKFHNNTDYSATFIIPNADKLFEGNVKYDSLIVSNIKYLFIPLQAGGHSNPLKINTKAVPDSISAIYPYSIFCLDGKYAAEMNSSPIIIVRP